MNPVFVVYPHNARLFSVLVRACVFIRNFSFFSLSLLSSLELSRRVSATVGTRFARQCSVSSRSLRNVGKLLTIFVRLRHGFNDCVLSQLGKNYLEIIFAG